MNFVAYDSKGEITTAITGCPDDHVDFYRQPGLNIILDASGSPWTHYVLNNQLVAYTPEQSRAKKSSRVRSAGDVWSNATMSYEKV